MVNDFWPTKVIFLLILTVFLANIIFISVMASKSDTNVTNNKTRFAIMLLIAFSLVITGAIFYVYYGSDRMKGQSELSRKWTQAAIVMIFANIANTIFLVVDGSRKHKYAEIDIVKSLSIRESSQAEGT